MKRTKGSKQKGQGPCECVRDVIRKKYSLFMYVYVCFTFLWYLMIFYIWLYICTICTLSHCDWNRIPKLCLVLCWYSWTWFPADVVPATCQDWVIRWPLPALQSWEREGVLSHLYSSHVKVRGENRLDSQWQVASICHSMLKGKVCICYICHWCRTVSHGGLPVSYCVAKRYFFSVQLHEEREWFEKTWKHRFEDSWES